MPQVAMQRTQQTQEGLAGALTAELQPLGADRTTAAFLLALVNQETGSGSNLWNYNLGNITTADDSDDYWSPASGKAKGLHFRAYETLDDGARDFVRFVHGRPKLWSSAGTGDAGQFAGQIRDSKYNPDLNPSEAAPTLQMFAKVAIPLFSSLPAGRPITRGNAGSGWGGLALVALAWLLLKGNHHG